MKQPEAHIYSVTELTRDIRALLEGAFPAVWVEGEVSNYKVSAAGHIYFDLKDDSSLINCVMFRSSGSSLKFDIADGMQVLCSGRISVYDKRGQYQLYATRMEPKGKGALQLAFEQLKTRLLKEGLFDEEHKKPLPFLPVRVGVVTSSTGAAIRDILNVARRRFANIEITIRPVQVQGDKAAGEIARAIEEFNEYNEYLAKEVPEEHPVDVLIVGRGGGSIEDLWPFNEEAVARAIYASKIPVISAVGHEVDFTISDFVADLRAATPTEAAELVIPVREDLAAGIDRLLERMYSTLTSRIEMTGRELKRLKDSYVLRAPMNVILQLRQQVDDMVQGATVRITHLVELKKRHLESSAGRLNALSPLAVLERGYSITFKGEHVVKSVKKIKKGDMLKTRLTDGSVESKVV